MSALDFTRSDVQAHYIEQAADHIQRYGKHNGSWWELKYDEHGIWQPTAAFEDGSSCCTVGAIAVSLGYRDSDDVHNVVCGINPFEDTPPVPHQVLAALMETGGFLTVEAIFEWSDSARDDQVVARLRYIADQLRGGSACTDLPADDHKHCPLHGCVEYVCCIPTALVA